MQKVKKIFFIQANVDELTELYKNGMSKRKLAVHFNVDRSTIIYQVRKRGLLTNAEILENNENHA
nr:hypothetical protein [Moritella viscosa]SHO03633.1 Transcriptional regulatory protein tyrR [Moritella viscosa]